MVCTFAYVGMEDAIASYYGWMDDILQKEILSVLSVELINYIIKYESPMWLKIDVMFSIFVLKLF